MWEPGGYQVPEIRRMEDGRLETKEYEDGGIRQYGWSCVSFYFKQTFKLILFLDTGRDAAVALSQIDLNCSPNILVKRNPLNYRLLLKLSLSCEFLFVLFEIHGNSKMDKFYSCYTPVKLTVEIELVMT